MTRSTSTARESLARALSLTTVHRRLMLPGDLADHLLEPDDEVLLALPGVPGDTGQILLVTAKEVVLAQWDAEGDAPRKLKRKREAPAADVASVTYRPGLYLKLRVKIRSGRDLAIEPCTAEDGIRFAAALNSLATTGRLPGPMPPEEVLTALHASGNYSPDSPEMRMRAAWDRALLATTELQNCEAVHSGPALGWLQPGEHTLLVLVGQKGVSTEYLAVTDRRVLRGSAPGRRTKDRAPGDVARAEYDEGRLKDVVRVRMHDGSSLDLDGINDLEGQEFVDALNALITTGALPPELQPFR